MVFGRENETKALQKLYEKDINEAVVFYGSKDNQVTDIVKDFIKNKEFFYYDALPVSKECQLEKFYNDIVSELPKQQQVEEKSYSAILQAMLDVKCEKRIVVISNFQNIIKTSPEFMPEIIKCLNNKWSNQSVLFILLSENPYWVEKQMVEKIGESAYELSGLIKVHDLPFIEFVRYFKNYSLLDLVTVYSILGGRNKYLYEWDLKESVQTNIENCILSQDSYLFEKGKNLLPEELREPTVYNTLLYTIASGKEKLNDIHKATNYSRAKISVYLNNLIDFDLVEKIDSFDSPGRENARKGIYRIKDRYTAFYYKYVFSHISELNFISKEKFYKKYIESDLISFSADSFRLVCVEYLSLLNRMNKLPYSFGEFGCWIGKVGDIDIVAEDKDGNNLIGLCNWENETMTYEDYEWLTFCVKQAKLSDDVYYLFSRNDFDERLKEEANNNSNIYLIDSTML